jgi:hypothetical protein
VWPWIITFIVMLYALLFSSIVIVVDVMYMLTGIIVLTYGCAFSAKQLYYILIVRNSIVKYT